MFAKIANFFRKKPKTPPIHTGVKPLSAYHYKKQREYNSPVPSPAPAPSDSSDVLLTALMLSEIISSNRISDTDYSENKSDNFASGQGGDFGGAGATSSWDKDSSYNDSPAPAYDSSSSNYSSDSSSSSYDSGSSWSSSSDSSSSYDSGSSYSDSSSSSSFD